MTHYCYRDVNPHHWIIQKLRVVKGCMISSN